MCNTRDEQKMMPGVLLMGVEVAHDSLGGPETRWCYVVTEKTSLAVITGSRCRLHEPVREMGIWTQDPSATLCVAKKVNC